MLYAIKYFLRSIGFYRWNKMKIKFLKAGSGDCILIRVNAQNILIDGGNDDSQLLIQLDVIHAKGEVLDLIIITHHDEDHILGILNVLKELKKERFGDPKKFVKKILFNSPRKVLGIEIFESDNFLSYRQACDVEELITELNLDWDICTEETEPIKFGAAVFKFLSPISTDLTKYGNQEGAFLSSQYRSDWDSRIKELLLNVDDASLDQSLPNQTSIVILIENKESRVLLTGDVTPKRLNTVITEYLNEVGKGELSLDYMKLPHHGSYRSLSRELLSKINCSNFIISTNSSRYYLPNKRAIVKVLTHVSNSGSKIKFHFNYKQSIDKLKISHFEEKEFNFELIPNNEKYGVEI